MDPITMSLMAVGTGMQIFGGLSASHIAGQEANAKAAIAGYEKQADEQRRQAMELDAQRRSMEVLRNAQRARAMGLQSATNQGAQQGSGLQGGYGQISGASNTNLLGISQNLQIGRNLFDINAHISDEKTMIANLGGDMAKAQAWSSFGGDISKLAGPAGNLSKGFGGSNNMSFTDFGTGQGSWPMFT